MDNEVRYIYIYSPGRDKAMLAINCVIDTMLFYIIFSITAKFADMTLQFGYVQVVYWILFGVCTTGTIVSILCKTKKCLQITDTEINYQYGMLKQHKVIVPISKVQSCENSASTLQKKYDSSTLSIYATEDAGKICFEDIKDGEEACRIIKNLIKPRSCY